MLNYTNAQFNRRMNNAPEGTCMTCGKTPEYDNEPGGRPGYYSTCSHCRDLFHQGKVIQHSHMFQHSEGYRLASGEQWAWPTAVDMRPAFVSGQHVGWFCAGGHGSEPCKWNLTNAEAQQYFDAWAERHSRR